MAVLTRSTGLRIGWNKAVFQIVGCAFNLLFCPGFTQGERLANSFFTRPGTMTLRHTPAAIPIQSGMAVLTTGGDEMGLAVRVHVGCSADDASKRTSDLGRENP